MSQTRDSAPAATVSDKPERGQAKKPAPVRLAVICLWISAAIILVVGMVGPPGHGGFTSIFGFILFALTGFIAEKIRAGRAWARWLFLVVYVLNSVSLLSALLALLSEPLAVQAFAIGVHALQTAAFVSLLTRTSRQWFKSSRAATTRSAP